METVRRQPQTHGGSSPIHHHHARERSRQVWRGSPVAGHSLSREFHRFAMGIRNCVCDSGPWDRVPFVSSANYRRRCPPPSERTRRRSTLPGLPLGAGVGLGEAATASTTSQPGGGGVGSILTEETDRTLTPNDHRVSRGTRDRM